MVPGKNKITRCRFWKEREELVYHFRWLYDHSECQQLDYYNSTQEKIKKVAYRTGLVFCFQNYRQERQWRLHCCFLMPLSSHNYIRLYTVLVVTSNRIEISLSVRPYQKSHNRTFLWLSVKEQSAFYKVRFSLRRAARPRKAQTDRTGAYPRNLINNEPNMAHR